MSAPKQPLYPIAGNQALEHLMKFILNAKGCAKRYEVLKEMADLATQRIEQVGKVGEIAGLLSKAKTAHRMATEALEAAQKKAQGQIDEAEGVVAALYGDFEEGKAKHEAEYEEFLRDQATAVQELGRREETAAAMREEAATATEIAATLQADAERKQAEYAAKAKAMRELI